MNTGYFQIFMRQPLQIYITTSGRQPNPPNTDCNVHWRSEVIDYQGLLCNLFAKKGSQIIFIKVWNIWKEEKAVHNVFKSFRKTESMLDSRMENSRSSKKEWDRRLSCRMDGLWQRSVRLLKFTASSKKYRDKVGVNKKPKCKHNGNYWWMDKLTLILNVLRLMIFFRKYTLMQIALSNYHWYTL